MSSKTKVSPQPQISPRDSRPGSNTTRSGTPSLQELVQRVTELVERDPAKAATLLRDWINRPASIPVKKTG